MKNKQSDKKISSLNKTCKEILKKLNGLTIQEAKLVLEHCEDAIEQSKIHYP